MNETRQTKIIEEIKTFDEQKEVALSPELETKEEILEETEKEFQEEIDPRVEKRDQLFEDVKNVLLNQDRILKKFFLHSDEHCEFDYEEMGLSFEEEEEHLRRTNKLKDKILDNLETDLSIQCKNREIDTLHNMIICDSSFEEETFRIVLEVYEDSFDLEII